jgi:hypothetical protein
VLSNEMTFLGFVHVSVLYMKQNRVIISIELV